MLNLKALQPTLTQLQKGWDRLCQRPWILTASLAAVVFLFYMRVANYGYIQLDDPKHIFENPHLFPPKLSGLVSLWKEAYFGLYIPVTYTTWWAVSFFDHLLSPGITPKSYHLLNVFIHVANTVLLFVLLSSQLLPKVIASTQRIYFAALIGAACFAFHPVQLEAIAWISGAKDLLCTFFCLLSWLSFRRATSQKSSAFFILSALLFMTATLAKPNAVVLPIVIGLFEWLWFAAHPKKLIHNLSLSLALMVPMALLTLFTQSGKEVKSLLPIWGRPWVALDALGFYIWKLVFPLYYSIDYSRAPVDLPKSPMSLAYLALSAMTIYTLWKHRLSHKTLCIAGTAVLFLLPVLGFVPFLYQTFSTVADRYLYLPFTILAVAIAWASTRSKIAALMSPLALLFFALISTNTLGHWRDGISIFALSAKNVPESLLANNNAGVELQVSADYERAAEYFRKAMVIDPDRADLQMNLGAALVESGQLEEGLSYLELAAKNKGEAEAFIYYNLSKAYLRMGNFQKAKEHAFKSQSLLPSSRRTQRLVKSFAALE